MSDVAGDIVEGLFKDLRDRRFLKWLFSEQPCLIGDVKDLKSLDLDVQGEIKDAWIAIIRTALRPTGDSHGE